MEPVPPPSPRHSLLGTFTLTMLSISAIISLRNFPLMASQGYASIFFYGLAALLFFIPAALSAAELVSGWPGKGGIYHWVSEAFGPKVGGIAIWLEWIEGVVWLPAVLSFIAATTAYLVQPLVGPTSLALVDDRRYLVTAMLVILWFTTLLNGFGLKTSSRFSTVGVILGSIVPSALIILLGFYWAFKGHPLQITFSPAALMPEFSFDTLVFFTGVLLSFGGIEVAAYHIQDTQHPQKTFPRATFIAAGLILTLYVLGSLAIAFVIPTETIHLFGGVMQAFQHFFRSLGFPHLTGCAAIMILLGAMAMLNTWIIGPSKGLLVSAEAGNLPHFFTQTNRFQSPVRILYSQGLIGSLLTTVFFWMPTLNSSYMILVVLTSQLILLMYLFMFASVIYLRWKHPHTPRSYRIPGGLPGVIAVAGAGALASILTFFIGFVPPSTLEASARTAYISFLVIGVIGLSLPPFLWYGWQHIQKIRGAKSHACLNIARTTVL